MGKQPFVVKVGIFAVRVVNAGDRYGVNHSITHVEAEPMVEFYDTRYGRDAPEFFQFITRYYYSTLTNRGNGLSNSLEDLGLVLDSGSESWRVSDEEMQKVMEALRLYFENAKKTILIDLDHYDLIKDLPTPVW